jgi:hypothetical protein
MAKRYRVSAYDVRAFACMPRDEDNYYPRPNNYEYETYIAQTYFDPPLAYFIHEDRARRTQRMHIHVHALGTAAHQDASTARANAPARPAQENDSPDAAYSIEAHDAQTIEHRIVIDSGASAHKTGSADHLFDTKHCNRQVIVANGGVTTATSIGKLNISTPTRRPSP